MTDFANLVGTTLRDTLVITKLIGEGSMGAVFLAEHRHLPDKRFAIKVLLNAITSRPIFRERFNEEARNQASLDHPNIVKVHDYFRENGQYFLVMDYVEGEPLSDLIDRSGAMDENQAIKLMDGILLGLDYAHRHGIVHRDVKPSNILVDGEMRPRLTDFGIAIRAGETRLTSTGAASVGTAAYMSPEQIRTPGDIDQRADVYSAGVVLFEMLTGKVPFDGDNDFVIHEQHINARVPNPRDIDPALSRRVCALVQKALSKDPAQRFRGCEEFRSYLSGERASPIRHAPRWAAAGGGVAVLGLALAASWPALHRLEHRRGAFPQDAASESLRLASSTVRPEQDMAARKAEARRLILSSVQLLEIICQQSADIARKQEGQRIAEKIPDTARAAAFGAQVRDLQSNVAMLFDQYQNSLADLSRLDASALRDSLGEMSRDPMRSAFGALVDEHVNAHSRRPTFSVTDLPGICSRTGIANAN